MFLPTVDTIVFLVAFVGKLYVFARNSSRSATIQEKIKTFYTAENLVGGIKSSVGALRAVCLYAHICARFCMSAQDESRMKGSF